ncbi:MAG TPA: glycosyltransferase 87 family protein [Candidatus Ozemobacteraceae bacterium]|nr:glycosyltransferase 87 family protein [Candidatus Ozemobacteraceae bacterium]
MDHHSTVQAIAEPGSEAAARLLRSASRIVIPLLVIFVWVLRMPAAEDDFRIFRQAGVDLTATGNPYHSTPGPEAAGKLSREAAAETKVFLYPPFAAYLFRPFGFLTPEHARDLWFFVNLGLLVVSFLAAWHALAPPTWEGWKIPAFVLFFLSPPVLMTFNLGQVSLLLSALILPAWRLSSTFPAAAGLLLAVATHIKLFPAILCLAFIRTAPRTIPWTAAWIVIVAAIVTFAGGASQWSAFFQTTLASSFYPVTGEFNISLNGFFRRLLSENPHVRAIADAPQAATVLTTAAALVVSAACLRLSIGAPRRGTTQDRSSAAGVSDADPLVFSAWLVGMLLLSPLNGFYNHTLLLFPALAVLGRLSQAGTLRSCFILPGVAFLLACWWPPGWAEKYVSLNIWLREGWRGLFLTPSFYGLVLFLRVVTKLATDTDHRP